MNTPVSFPLVKLLKEKEFKQEDSQYIWVGNKYEKIEKREIKRFIEAPVFEIHSNSTLPTIAEVLMWLYEKHNVWISVVPYNDEELSQTLWENKTIDIADDYNDCSDYTFYHSPTEAYEAAIEYTLNNLI